MKILSLLLLAALQAQPAPLRTIYVQDFSNRSSYATMPGPVTGPFGAVMPIYVDSAKIVRERLGKKCPAVQVVTSPDGASFKLVIQAKNDRPHGAELMTSDGAVVFTTGTPAEWKIANDVCKFVSH